MIARLAIFLAFFGVATVHAVEIPLGPCRGTATAAAGIGIGIIFILGCILSLGITALLLSLTLITATNSLFLAAVYALVPGFSRRGRILVFLPKGTGG